MNQSQVIYCPARRRRKSRGPFYASVWFALHALNWVAVSYLALKYLRPHPLTRSDMFVGAFGLLLAVFYVWVAVGVYQRRRSVFTPALACAGLGLFSIPFGTVLSIFLLVILMSRQHDFTK